MHAPSLMASGVVDFTIDYCRHLYPKLETYLKKKSSKFKTTDIKRGEGNLFTNNRTKIQVKPIVAAIACASSLDLRKGCKYIFTT